MPKPKKAPLRKKHSDLPTAREMAVAALALMKEVKDEIDVLKRDVQSIRDGHNILARRVPPALNEQLDIIRDKVNTTDRAVVSLGHRLPSGNIGLGVQLDAIHATISRQHERLEDVHRLAGSTEERLHKLEESHKSMGRTIHAMSDRMDRNSKRVSALEDAKPKVVIPTPQPVMVNGRPISPAQPLYKTFVGVYDRRSARAACRQMMIHSLPQGTDETDYEKWIDFHFPAQ